MYVGIKFDNFLIGEQTQTYQPSIHNIHTLCTKEKTMWKTIKAHKIK